MPPGLAQRFPRKLPDAPFMSGLDHTSRPGQEALVSRAAHRRTLLLPGNWLGHRRPSVRARSLGDGGRGVGVHLRLV